MTTPTPAADAREALKPCPFCGGGKSHVCSPGSATAYVECDDCGAFGPDNDRDGALWNRRAAGWTPPQPEAGGVLSHATQREVRNRAWREFNALSSLATDRQRLDRALDYALAAQPDTAPAEGLIWRNPAPHAAAAAMPSGPAGRFTAGDLAPAPAEATGGWRPPEKPRQPSGTVVGILNPWGDFWTPITFNNERDAAAYVAKFWAGTSQDISKYRFVPVEVSLKDVEDSPPENDRGHP